MAIGIFELLIISGVGFALAGKKDLPRAANFAGTQVGRLVGFFQGARARADLYSQQNEMRSLQNELRSGLRELDAVRAELTQTFTRPMGRQLGATTPNANRSGSIAAAFGSGGAPTIVPPASPPGIGVLAANPTVASDLSNFAAASSSTPLLSSSTTATYANSRPHRPSGLAPLNHTIGAIAEEEWERGGIAFKSRAETGSGLKSYDHTTAGSALLANLLQQSLVFDQYDRVTQKQDQLLQSKVEEIKQRVQNSPTTTTATPVPPPDSAEQH